VTLYLLLACAPLVIAALPPRPVGRPFVVELGIALGFIGLGQIALQFGLIARSEKVTRPFGIDLVMQYHRQMGTLAIALVIAHAVVASAARPSILADLVPSRGGAGPFAGLVSIVALAWLRISSGRRKQLGLRYESWRLLHLLLSVVGLAAALVHVLATGIYAAIAWKRAVLIAYSCACVLPVVWLRLVLPARLKRRPYVVADVRAEAGSTWSVALTPEGHPGLRFAPGQFAWLRIGGSPWSLEEHPFSFSSSADRAGRIEFAVKELGDFTGRIGSVRPGTRAWVDGPHGSFSIDFVQDADSTLFVAGGIGIAPVMSILRTLYDRRDRRSHVLVYGCTTREGASFGEEIEEMKRVLDLQVVIVPMRPPEGWPGPSGHVTRELLAPLAFESGAPRTAFVCGPDGMMSSVEESLRACGLPPGKIHMERFQLV
jgi:predicted ferric reductase